jgi:competence protein ComGC
MVPLKGQTGPAWIAVIALAIGLLLFLVVPAFSQRNARTSVDGHKAVYSHNLP